MTTLKDLIFHHNNDYGFDASQVIETMALNKTPNLSIVIPYYDVGSLFQTTLAYLESALKCIQEEESDWKHEIVIVDDGSKKYTLAHDIQESFTTLNIIVERLFDNQGRTKARQTGLEKAQYPVVLFMDADILVSSNLIRDHLRVQAHYANKFHQFGITVSFFEFISPPDPRLSCQNSETVNIVPNDYRISCIFQPTWFLGERDKKFIGEEINIVSDTDGFRSWRGWYKAWILPNMVLGGLFACDRQLALETGGFESSFTGYGFTETTLPSKLIGIKKSHVIPITSSYALHVEAPENISRDKKDLLLREKYAYYHDVFLQQEV